MAALGDPLELSARFVQQCPGLAIDADSISIKILYRNKQDWTDYETSTGDKSRNKIRLKSFAVGDVDAIIAFLQEHAQLSDGAEIEVTDTVPEAVIQTCSQKLNVKCNPLSRRACQVGAHRYLFQHVPTRTLKKHNVLGDGELDGIIASKEDFLANTMPHLEEVSDWEMFPGKVQEYKDYVLEVTGMKVHKKEERKLEPGEYPGVAEMEDSLDYYPCLLVDIGDTVTYTKVMPGAEKHEIVNLNMLGLESMLGLASLMIGVNDLDELVSLAENGDYSTIHAAWLSHDESKAMAADRKNKLYTNMTRKVVGWPTVVFSFANGLGKSSDDFSKEDMAAALLHYVFMDITNRLVHRVLPGSGIRHVMAAGSMLERPLLAKLFMYYWYSYSFYVAMTAGEVLHVKAQVLSVGSYLGAIGAMVNTVQPFHIQS